MLVLILDMSSRQKQLFPRINASSIIVAAFSCFEHVYWGCACAEVLFRIHVMHMQINM